MGGGWHLQWRTCRKRDCDRTFGVLEESDQAYCCLVHDPDYIGGWSVKPNLRKKTPRKTAEQKVWGKKDALSHDTATRFPRVPPRKKSELSFERATDFSQAIADVDDDDE